MPPRRTWLTYKNITQSDYFEQTLSKHETFEEVVDESVTVANVAGRNADGKIVGAQAFTIEEVAKHNSYEDAWIIIRNEVFDVSGWAEHPGA